MKRFIVTLAVLLCFTMMMTGADIRFLAKVKKSRSEKTCVGYTIIEASKGINCTGDTVRLQRVNGFYQVVTHEN